MAVVLTDFERHVRNLGVRWRHYLHAQLLLVVVLASIFFFIPVSEQYAPLDKRSWGGWDERADTERCYKQERTATLLAFWLGVFGADHWYARHWILAVFKTATLGGLGIWAVVDVNLWIVGGYYGTPGCPGGSKKEWAY
ncbi:hypothetical protein AA0112_g11572 [Alternaria arborescens]|nr:hypothetical protein AA0112_g11572 [Alternaria arborescens]